MSFVLLNDGTSFLLLNDGSSKVELNDAGVGLSLIGTHSTQQVWDRSPELKIPVEFTFRLKANTILRGVVNILRFEHLLNPKGLYTTKLSESFKIPLTEAMKKIKPILEHLHRKAELENLIREAANDPGLILVSYFKSILKTVNEKLSKLNTGVFISKDSLNDATKEGEKDGRNRKRD